MQWNLNANVPIVRVLVLQKHILASPLSSRNLDDQLIWHHNKNKIYSLKSGYNMAFSRILCNSNMFPSSSIHRSWSWIWHLKIPPKGRVFLWKVFKKILPISSNLISRGVVLYPICARCGQEIESAEHALRDYKWCK